MDTTTTTTYDDARDAYDNTSEAGAAGTTLAAAFAHREQAHDAVHQLHDEGFGNTWIGLTRSNEDNGYDAPEYDEARYDGAGSAAADATAVETRVEAENWFTRFFGEGDEPLSDALIRHGVSAAEARSAGPLEPHSAILTVDGANHPELAVQIITQCGGRLITSGFGATGYGTAGYGTANYGTQGVSMGSDKSQAPAPRTTTLNEDADDTAAYDAAAPADVTGLRTGIADSDPTRSAARGTERSDATDTAVSSVAARRDSMHGAAADAAARVDYLNETAPGGATDYDDYGRYRAGNAIDESTRLQLREERLRVDKSRISSGEATIGTDVVTQRHEIDVPLVREELFIERRPASGASPPNTAPIGSNDVIRIPLSEERVVVSKVPVVTQEVVVGKRDVQDTQHISETTRKEQLNVNDARTATVGTRDSRLT